MGEGPRRIVADGYDRIAERYLEWIGRQPSAARLEALEWLLGELHDGSARWLRPGGLFFATAPLV